MPDRLVTDPVPNQFPALEPPGVARIAVIGEAPGRDEAYYGTPFVGLSGRVLDASLGRLGLARAQCFVGNVCQHRPAGESNEFSRLAWDGSQVQAGIEQLLADLERFNPTMVLCLGNAALHLFKHGNVAPSRKGGLYDWPSKVGDWRGSLFESKFLQSEIPNPSLDRSAEPAYEASAAEACRKVGLPLLKCMAAYHPAAVSREPSLQAYYRCWPGIGDFERLRLECKSRELNLPERNIKIYAPCYGFTAWQAAQAIRYLPRTALANDIEGSATNITCIAYAKAACEAVVVPFAHIDGTSVWSEEDEISIWEAVKERQEDLETIKIGQWYSYDTFAMAWGYGITTQGRIWDTAELWWECFAELDKGLDVQASLLTREPFYKPDKEKGELKFDSDEQFWHYNGVDACVTWECWAAEMKLLKERQLAHATFNSDLFASAKLYPMLRGIRVDKKKVKELREAAEQGVWEMQARIDEAAGDPKWRELRCLAEALDESRFAQLCLAQLGGKNPRVPVEVVEERWQRMEFSEKTEKWIKRGKMLTKKHEHGDWPKFETEPDPIEYRVWLKPCPRTVTKLQAFTPTSLTAVEPHVLESHQIVWKRIKQLWKELSHQRKELKYDQQANDQRAESQVSRSQHPDDKRGVGPVRDLGENHGRAGADDFEGCGGVSGGSGPLFGEAGAAGAGKELKHEQHLRSKDSSAALREQSSGGEHRVLVRSDQKVPSTNQRFAALLGELSTLLSLAVNVGSTSEGGDAQWFLFESCGLPRIFKDEKTKKYSRENESAWRKRVKEGVRHERTGSKRARSNKQADLGRVRGEAMELGEADRSVGDTKELGDASESAIGDETNLAGGSNEPAFTCSSKRLSTDGPALSKLYVDTADVRVLWVMQQRRLRMTVSDLSKPIDADGRVRSSISLVKETGRMAASKSPLGTGTNLMALNKDLLSICVADEGCELGKYDLEGADSWTVAAECAALGDPTMLNDLRAGMKPAKGLCYGYHFMDDYAKLSAEEILARLANMKLEEWLYPGAKSTLHGYCYGSGWITTRDTILKYSMADLPLNLADAKPVLLSKAQIDKLRGAAALRYPGIAQWHKAEAQAQLTTGWIETSTGHRRLFYGQKARWEKGKQVADHDTLKERLASKPQYYTTRVIKEALFRLWNDPENQEQDFDSDSGVASFTGQLRVEPLMARHDELLVQWRLEDRAWAQSKMKQWLTAELEIAGQQIVIPADGKVGQNWGMK